MYLDMISNPFGQLTAGHGAREQEGSSCWSFPEHETGSAGLDPGTQTRVRLQTPEPDPQDWELHSNQELQQLQLDRSTVPAMRITMFRDDTSK